MSHGLTRLLGVLVSTPSFAGERTIVTLGTATPGGGFPWYAEGSGGARLRRRALIRRLSLGAIGMTGVTALAEAMARDERRGERMPAPFALKDDSEPITDFNDALAMGSISMRSLLVG